MDYSRRSLALLALFVTAAAWLVTLLSFLDPSPTLAQSVTAGRHRRFYEFVVRQTQPNLYLPQITR